jgi:hypothetical protein
MTIVQRCAISLNKIKLYIKIDIQTPKLHFAKVKITQNKNKQIPRKDTNTKMKKLNRYYSKRTP